MSTKTIGQSFLYSLTPVNLPEATPGSCRGVFHSNGLVAFGELTANAAAARPNVMDGQTMEMVVRAFFAEVAAELSQNHRVTVESLGLTFSVEIGGSFPSMDAPPGEDNPLYVDIRLDGKLRDVLKDVVPTRTDASADGPKLYAEEDIASHQPNVIDGCNPFVLTGHNLSAGGEDERLQLVDSAKETHVATIQSCQRGQRITAAFATPPAAGKAELKLLTHGALTPEGGLYGLTKKLTVLAGDVPPGPVGPLPVVTQVNAQGVDENPVVNTSAVTFIGEHFDNATLKVSYDDGRGGTEEHDLSIYAAGSDDEVLITEDDWYQEAGLSSNFKDLTFTITTPNGSTTAEASYQPE